MGQDLPNTEFLFDFIYIDRSRIASYSAQIFDEGVLVSTKSILQTGEGDSKSVEGNLQVLKGGGAHHETELRSLERQFDAAWSLPLNVINRLDELGYVSRDIQSAAIGQVVLIKGRLRIIDFRFLKGIWEPILHFTLQENQGKGKHPSAKEKENVKRISAIVGHLPHAIQATVQMEDGNIGWTTLGSDHMTINPEDLALKYGPEICGSWQILGVLDARPDQEPVDNFIPAINEFETGMLQMLLGVRVTLGRPFIAFGFTPLMIFRKVTK